jgi:hypothetical protein
MAPKKATIQEKALTPVDQKTVEFYGDDLVAIRADDGRIYVSVRHMSEALGLDRGGQIRRIRRQTVLENGLFKGDILSPKGKRKANWLRVDLVPLFLAGISTNAVKEEIRPKLEAFQKEAAAVLWEAFQEGRLTTDRAFDDLLSADSEAVQAYHLALAVVKLARSQLILESRVDTTEGRLEDVEDRLDQVESTLGDPKQSVTPEQASQISQSVKTVATILTKQSGSSQYGAVYGELYRKFGITSYKMLPAKRFDDAMKFLTDWHGSLVGDEPF